MVNRYKFMLCVTTTLSLGALGLGAAPALAQSAPPAATAAAPSDLGTVVVTARRIEERLQDVPIAITVFNQQTLANENVVNSEDLARITPSLSANTNYGADNSSFSIRGFIQEQGTAPTVGVYFADVVAPRGPSDEITAGDGAGAGSFFDLQNVQVLEGPQGTLQGRNTTGGSVLLVPQKPTGNYDGYVEASYGNYDMRRIQAVVNVPINDNLRFRVGIDDQKRDGYLNNVSPVGPKHFGNVDYTALRASLVWDITPNVENYTIASYSFSHTYGDVQKVWTAPGGLLSAFAAPSSVTTPGWYDIQNSEPNPQSTLETWQIINTTTWHASDNLTVRNIASYAQLKDDLDTSLFGFVANIPGAGGLYPTGFADANSIAGGDTAHEATVTEEFRLNGSEWNDRFTWQSGFYSEFALPIGTVGTQSPTLASCTNPLTTSCNDPLGAIISESYGFPPGTVRIGTIDTTGIRTSSTDYGLYGQASYKFTDQFKLTGGYRYTWDRQAAATNEQSSYLQAPPNYGIFSTSCVQPQTVPSCVSHIYADSSKPTWLIDFDYTPIKDLLVYAKYARGYREGTIASNLPPPVNTARPESVDNFEVGFKSTFRAPVRGTFDADIFYNSFTNQQIQVGFNAIPGSGYASTAAPINAGASTIYGLELQSSVNPLPGLVISVAYTYLDTRIDKVTNVNLNIPGFITAAEFQVGDPIVLTPKNKASLNAEYRLPFIPSSVGKVLIGGSYTHTDRTLSNYIDGQAGVPTAFARFAYLPSTDLVDLRASWNGIFGKPVDLSFFATNITGEKYYTMAAGLGTSGLGIESTQQGLPTMYGFRLKYHFGK